MKANLSINWKKFWGQWSPRRVFRAAEGEGGGSGEVDPLWAAWNIREVPGPPGLGGTMVTDKSWLQGSRVSSGDAVTDLSECGLSRPRAPRGKQDR